MNANKQDAGGEVTNPDNVGGLPERWRGLADKCEAEFPQKAQIFRWCANELCRAAPAGGDDWPFLEEIGRDGKPTGYWIRKGSPAAARMSAPAGSGEVEGFISDLEKADSLLAKSKKLSPEILLGRVFIKHRAAILRKLQQGAE